MSARRGARAVLLLVALVAGTWGLLVFAHAGDGATARAAASGTTGGAAGDPAAGQRLFAVACSSCHGPQGRGIAQRGPDLRGAGAQAADFYLRTGRMPLAEPDDEPVRAPVQYSDAQIDDLVAYVAALGGPPIPSVDPAAGSLARGRELFTSNCAGCHQIVARGGIVVGATAPALQQANAREIAEAIRVGPYVMPRFSARQLDQRDIDDVTRYVLWTRKTADAGGWGIGDIGPIPEGMVAWLIALLALLGVARLIGEGQPK
jgi:ubiquinol-cytochrome c reductase cytochrome c subunit